MCIRLTPSLYFSAAAHNEQNSAEDIRDGRVKVQNDNHGQMKYLPGTSVVITACIYQLRSHT